MPRSAMKLHPLSTDITKPERFTYPFCYEPHPLCLLAAEEVKQEIARIQPTEGKMFGVLVVEERRSKEGRREGENRFAFLAAYSGLLEGRNDWDYFVPPVFDAQQPDGYFKQKEREISRISRDPSNPRFSRYPRFSRDPRIARKSKEMSQELQLWLFQPLFSCLSQVEELLKK